MCNAAQTWSVDPVRLESVEGKHDYTSEVDMAVIAGVPVPEAASDASLETVPDGSRPVSCPMCHTTHPSLSHDALEAGGKWRCTRCGQRWDATRLVTVAAYTAWVVAQDTMARTRGTAIDVSEALPE